MKKKNSNFKILTSKEIDKVKGSAWLVSLTFSRITGKTNQLEGLTCPPPEPENKYDITRI